MKGIWEIIKAIGKFIQGTGTFALGTLVLLLLVFALAGSQRSSELKAGVSVPKGAVLLLNPRGNIVELKQEVSPFDIALTEFSNAPVETSIHDILKAIHNAKNDKRIGAIALYTDSMGGAGIAHLHDIVDALKDFKTTDKPVYAISSSYSQGDYLIASQADQIFMNKAGSALLTGYNANLTYFKGMLDKVGVTVNIFHVGDYKSAIEPYERTSMSDEARASYEFLFNGLWNDYLSVISEARGMDKAALQQHLDQFPEEFKTVKGNFAEYALKTRLVDTLASRVDYRNVLADKHGQSGDTFKQISMQNYLRATKDWNSSSSSNEIPVLIAQGNIVGGYGNVTVVAAETVARDIRRLRKDENTKAIVLRVNSPGGSAYASEIIRQELVAAQAQGIPVVVSMGPVAASGGYWISAEADEIWASPTTITGSIGIFGMIPTFEKVTSEIGISSDSVGTSKWMKGMGIADPLNEAYSSVISANIQNGYDEFLDLVARGRNMTKETVHEIAQGRVWTGRQALENGLVDKLGTLDDAINAAAKLADIENYNSYIVKDAPDEFDEMLKQLLRRNSDTNAPKINPAQKVLKAFKKEFEFLSLFNDPQGRYILCTGCGVQE
ncbi:signal peptide peptidase SppA [Temperatibacter marinus]|uniref:Signal peptide peptidase SppA n=1 Tax=Temperatibacter marinus TaxID=1456591 RepID=A0AA52H962_9PROT|nr:signal peptide peptidase SppA [Temperatibacter marinus]WND02559.1 signal peptide peptidase SppA [Temperatibacter marinus]